MKSFDENEVLEPIAEGDENEQGTSFPESNKNSKNKLSPSKNINNNLYNQLNLSDNQLRHRLKTAGDSIKMSRSKK